MNSNLLYRNYTSKLSCDIGTDLATKQPLREPDLTSAQGVVQTCHWRLHCIEAAYHGYSASRNTPTYQMQDSQNTTVHFFLTPYY